jgi:hypothetical protein
MGKQQNRNLEARPAVWVHRLRRYMGQDFAAGNTQVRDWNIVYAPTRQVLATLQGDGLTRRGS